MTKTQPDLVLCELGQPDDASLASYSPFCLKIHRALQAAGLSYERRHGRPDSFKSHNPAGQVPVLLVDGEPVSDSTRILRWITEARPTAFRQTDPRLEAEAWLWEDFADTALNGYLVAARWADPRNWPAVKQAYFGGAPWPVRRLIVPMVRRRLLANLVARDVTRAGLDECWRRFERSLDQLEARAPEGGFWVSARLSVADVSLFGQLRSLDTALTPWQRDRLGERPRLARYLARVAAPMSLVASQAA
jgi:glutathione S-transferase